MLVNARIRARLDQDSSFRGRWLRRGLYRSRRARHLRTHLWGRGKEKQPVTSLILPAMKLTTSNADRYFRQISGISVDLPFCASPPTQCSEYPSGYWATIVIVSSVPEFSLMTMSFVLIGGYALLTLCTLWLCSASGVLAQSTPAPANTSPPNVAAYLRLRGQSTPTKAPG